MKTTCQTAWKRIVTALLLCSLLLCLCACGSAASSAKKAPLKGHDEPLADVINTVFELPEIERKGTKLSLEWENGWSGEGAPEQSVLGDNEKAVTMTMRATTDDEAKTMICYLAYDTSEKTLTAKGGLYEEDGETEIGSASEVNAELESFYKSFDRLED